MKTPFTQKEDLTLEYKEAAFSLPKNLFETVCAFLNRDGGLIILGVADDGAVTGINPDAVEKLKADIANHSNNPNKLDSPYLLFPHAEQIDGKWIIRIQVPCSSQVHRSSGEVFLRSEDGDYRLKDPYQIAGLVNRKLSFYTEQRVIPWLGMGDLLPALFDRARDLFRSQHQNHPWLTLSNEDVLRLGGFIRKDPLSADVGYTFAAALMFGSDATIQETAPGMVFDALLRRNNVDRYDDRLMLSTNLIDTFDQLMGFVEKHLNEPFHLEGNERISLRDRIFRELVSNLIAHREYTSAAPASMTVFRDKVVFKNPHVAHLRGRIDPEHFTPFPKNPTICRFMLQLGRYEQAGSGIFNVTKYLPYYSHGAKPVFEEQSDIFITTIPLEATHEPLGVSVSDEAKSSTQLATQLTTQLADPVKNLLSVLREREYSSGKLRETLGIRHRPTFRANYLHPALENGLIEQTIPDKPSSSKQKYRLTTKGRAVLDALPSKNN